MRKIQSFNITAQLALIQSKAQLSNSVSRQALTDAINTWSEHQAKYDYERNQNDLVVINRNISLIVTQVTNRICRINPLVWTELLKLNAALNVGIISNINFEPRPVPVVAANTDANHSEVA
ncbi:hypothetical protein [Psychrobacter sp. MES7-P7E]|uniref:hypothetical protein n=1 Tax=Psychrobacter sp. MES7-P7E TaxID=2058322 RepID=UPI000C7EBA13|nr:hypothetical protein [Psychrobacter sp. MES7-P7E]PLT21301.1 hypothetical protein CXF62_11035 [Psychrobacter sp. MES7-P7E]